MFEHDPNDTCAFDSAEEYNAAMATVYGPEYRAVTNTGFEMLKSQSSCGSAPPTPAQRQARAEEIQESIRGSARTPDSAQTRRDRRAAIERERANREAANRSARTRDSVAQSQYPAPPNQFERMSPAGAVVASVVALGVLGWLIWRK